MTARWLADTRNTAHLFARFEGWQARTLCGLVLPPAFIKEPKPPQPECRRCTDAPKGEK